MKSPPWSTLQADEVVGLRNGGDIAEGDPAPAVAVKIPVAGKVEAFCPCCVGQRGFPHRLTDHRLPRAQSDLFQRGRPKVAQATGGQQRQKCCQHQQRQRNASGA